MKRLLPSRMEVGIFAALAVVLAVAMSFIAPSAHDIGIAAMGGPVFLLAACMGLRRSPAWTMGAEESEEAD